MKKIKDNLGTFIITSIITLLPMFIGLLLWNKLPNEIAVHFDFNGTPDNYSSKVFTVFGLAAMIFAIHIICALVTTFDGKHPNGLSNKLYRLILWICPSVSIFVSVMVYGIALGLKLDVVFYVQLFIGLLFLILGNYLPKAKQNQFLGTRVKWTLESKKNWEHTNRFTGWVMCICGIFFIISALTGLSKVIDDIWFSPIFICFILIFALTSVLYSYVYYLKHRKDENYYE